MNRFDIDRINEAIGVEFYENTDGEDIVLQADIKGLSIDIAKHSNISYELFISDMSNEYKTLGGVINAINREVARLV